MSDEPTESERERAERSLAIRAFDDREMAARLSRARESMEAEGLDAIVLTDEPNVVHFSGLWTESFVSRARPIAAVLARDADPALICARSQTPNARASSWIEDVVPYDGFEPAALEAIEAALATRGLAGARVGIELGEQTRLGLSSSALEALRARAFAELVDAAPVIWSCRAIKSAAEIELMTRAGDANATALDRAIAAVAPGVTERELRSAWASSLVTDLALPGYFVVHSGPGSYRRVSGSATDRRLATGDLVWIDAGAIVDGYWSDLTRMTAVGEPTPEAIADYEFSRDLVGALGEAAVAGATTASLARIALDAYERASLPMSRISRFGHGLGRELTEPPSVSADDETELAPGMTIAVETGISRWDGYFVVEDNLAVTTGAAHLLAPRAPAELPGGS